jgi:hypothetical protein
VGVEGLPTRDGENYAYHSCILIKMGLITDLNASVYKETAPCVLTAPILRAPSKKPSEPKTTKDRINKTCPPLTVSTYPTRLDIAVIVRQLLRHQCKAGHCQQRHKATLVELYLKTHQNSMQPIFNIKKTLNFANGVHLCIRIIFQIKTGHVTTSLI